MPLYFFNVDNGQGPSRPEPPDREGTDLASPQAAREEAIVLAGEMLRDLDGAFWRGGEWHLRVTDEEGATVCTLRFSGTLGEGAG
jgi:hypothetical protein